MVSKLPSKRSFTRRPPILKRLIHYQSNAPKKGIKNTFYLASHKIYLQAGRFEKFSREFSVSQLAIPEAIIKYPLPTSTLSNSHFDISMRQITLYLLGLPFLFLLAACTTTSPYPDVSHDGLVRVEKSKADAVYRLPGTDLGAYTKVMLLEPQISFRKNWQQDTNSGRSFNRISDREMVQMIDKGKRLLAEQFTRELEKGGYQVVDKAGPDVLAVKPAIIDLDVTAPDPNNDAGIWVTTYSRGAGEATLQLELYDSVSRQLMVRAFDRKYDQGDGFDWRMPRTQASNIQDARLAFSEWARMLVKGLKQARESRAPSDATN
ncbi:MAG: DUF3313 family protein [Opitutales bacterium]